MSIDEVSRGLHRRRRRWPLVAILLAALMLPVTALVVTRTHLFGGGGLPDGLRRDLAAQVESILENSSVIAHVGMADHDHSGQTEVMCAVDPFGIDPATASGEGQVRWVYAQHLCVIAPPGTPWDYAPKSAGPVAVSLTNPPDVRLPQPSRDYRTQVREMIPARYLPQAFGYFAHPDLIAALRKRFTTQPAGATPTP